MSTEKIKCDKGWVDGSCCCNCKNQIKLLKHPMNKDKKLKGSISEHTGFYACIAFMDGQEPQTAIISEKQHGMCELYDAK